MPTAVYTGNYVDCGLGALAAFQPKLEFILSKESFSTDGQLLSTRPVSVTPATGDGAFTVFLVPNDLIQGDTTYKIRATYLDAASNFTSLDLFSFYARSSGGKVTDMLPVGFTPSLVFWQPEEPDPWPVGAIWVNSITDDVQRRTA